MGTGQIYTKVLDMGENLIIKCEVIAGDDIDAGLLLDVPVLKTQPLCFGKEINLGDLAGPVSFGGFLQITIYSHAGKTEDGSIERYISML